ncbi:MAG: NAD(P)H-dependent oxidoreductase subunit E [Candidatus Zixiibacteriota bacterium]|nr:MAG: NAD(P)H-dependent oxidoreductase subunit E [candidate division Zixibacteria bacterium]HHI02198.1 NAD(P)H-dependent oxidoreductase subunit E [candidate division Zixibacteria bacterium]
MIIDSKKIQRVIDRLPPDKKQLIMILQDIQQEFHYLPKESVRLVADYLGMPQSAVYSAATFYKSFSLIPRGENIIKVCKGTACHIKGADLIIDQLDSGLGIKPGETTKDLKYTVEVVNCVGACAMAPVMIVNDKYFGEVRCNRAIKIAKKG